MSYFETDYGPQPIWGDHNYLELLPPQGQDHVVVDGQPMRTGLVPRDMQAHPHGCYPWAPADSDVPMIPDGDVSAWIARKDGDKSWLGDIRMTAGPNGGPIPSLDQNGRGYCWRHSPTSAAQLYRGLMGQPFADLSPYAGACRIKNYRDEGGWGAQGVDDLVNFGDPTSEFWPQRAVDRKYDTPETWANAKLHTVLGQWADLSKAQYDRNLAFAQYISAFCQDYPGVCDFNWWGHSVCGCRARDGANLRTKTRMFSGKIAALNEFEVVWGMKHPITRGRAIDIWNSWGESYGQQGMGTLTGSKAIPDGGVVLKCVRPSRAA